MKELDAVIKTVVEGLRSISLGVEAIAKKLEDYTPHLTGPIHFGILTNHF